jgi:hypothetical protein
MRGPSLILIASVVMCSLATAANAECGSHGGPGVRDPKSGKCLGWHETHKCGPDLSSGCKLERVNPRAPPAHDDNLDIEKQRKKPQ